MRIFGAAPAPPASGARYRRIIAPLPVRRRSRPPRSALAVGDSGGFHESRPPPASAPSAPQPPERPPDSGTDRSRVSGRDVRDAARNRFRALEPGGGARAAPAHRSTSAAPPTESASGTGPTERRRTGVPDRATGYPQRRS